MANVTITATQQATWPNGPVNASITVNPTTAIQSYTPVNLSTTNQAVDLNFAVANVQALWMFSPQTVTVKTNSAGSPTQTLTLTGGVAYQWVAGGAGTNPFTSDVTAGLFITNATEVNTIVQIFIGTNA